MVREAARRGLVSPLVAALDETLGEAVATALLSVPAPPSDLGRAFRKWTVRATERVAALGLRAALGRHELGHREAEVVATRLTAERELRVDRHALAVGHRRAGRAADTGAAHAAIGAVGVERAEGRALPVRVAEVVRAAVRRVLRAGSSTSTR